MPLKIILIIIFIINSFSKEDNISVSLDASQRTCRTVCASNNAVFIFLSYEQMKRGYISVNIEMILVK